MSNSEKHTCPCLTICPVGAISVDKATNLIKIDQEKCIGCAACTTVCENGALEIDPETGKAKVNHDKCWRKKSSCCRDKCDCGDDCNCNCDDSCDCGCK